MLFEIDSRYYQKNSNIPDHILKAPLINVLLEQPNPKEQMLFYD